MVSCVVSVASSLYHLWAHTPVPSKIVVGVGSPRHHPIDDLIANATTTLHSLLSKQTTTLTDSASAYRERRGRHPPPGFDVWHSFASAHDAVLVEDFFDRIYDDLGPFWSVPAKQIRQQARQLPNRIVVRNRKVRTRKGDRKRLDQWIDMVQKIQDKLPDLDLPLNMLDEPRVAVSWEDISSYTETAAAARQQQPAHEVVKDFASLDIDSETIEHDEPTFSHESPYWDLVRAGCARDAPSPNISVPTNLSRPVNSPTPFTYEGFVSNWTRAKDPCLQPELASSHGALIAPLSQSTSQTLIPMFSSSKFSMNNDILLPAFAYWQSKSDYATGNSHGPTWDKKITRVVWRGISSGGGNTPENWRQFHRHRFVELMNASAVRSVSAPQTFHLPPYRSRVYTPHNHFELSRWIDAISDVAFTELQCTIGSENECAHATPYYKTAKKVPMNKQFAAKYLPDIDGNGFSGRYLAFLRSTSVPIKATLFAEWHDSRLVPWYHFVPMQNSFVDLYGILAYFVGWMGKDDGVDNGGVVIMEGGHDEQARRIAMQGKQWAEKVLRREDMLVYLLRLLLEYRRVCEDGRDVMGWVDDLLEKG
ncbi:glycosyltransferase family 90 protein [Karstenula rhodostoma CBS 690.94]|uniref:Glycosyltransferase family 90 protein n=1 Tax=Karstenula rhodostoma CBS 690.94 TaxID=1392251 RepID=A0A9P4U7Q8_9PLEO|nr:glycosyltransferase family 90 protein [Karstenula rhodostoma CBS 690.94]